MKEPNLSTIFPSSKTYTYIDSNTDSTYTLIFSEGDTNTLNLKLTEFVYDKELDFSYSGTFEYNLEWTGKGYKGEESKDNWVFYNGVIDEVSVYATFAKLKSYVYFDTYTQTIKSKVYGLAKLTASYQGQTIVLYLKATEEDDDFTEVTLSQYNSLINSFESDYENMLIQTTSGMSSDTKEQIFNDLGF